MIPSEAKAPWKSLNEKMAKVSIELDGVAISCANRGAVSALPSKIADTNCFFSPRVVCINRDKSRKNNEIHRGKRPIRRILFDRFKPSAYLCVIVIARESESEPVVHHNREIGKH